jgi:hypothetical protein
MFKSYDILKTDREQIPTDLAAELKGSVEYDSHLLVSTPHSLNLVPHSSS